MRSGALLLLSGRLWTAKVAEKNMQSWKTCNFAKVARIFVTFLKNVHIEVPTLDLGFRRGRPRVGPRDRPRI